MSAEDKLDITIYILSIWEIYCSIENWAVYVSICPIAESISSSMEE